MITIPITPEGALVKGDLVLLNSFYFGVVVDEHEPSDSAWISFQFAPR